MPTYTDKSKLKKAQPKPRKKHADKKSTRSTGSLKFTVEKRAKYVELLSSHGGRKNECAVIIGIGRKSVHDWETKDPAFGLAVKEAIAKADEIRMERLEAEAEERAVVGAPKVLVHKGVVVWARDQAGKLLEDENGNPYPMVEYQKSDVLMQTLLRAGDPKKYRESLKLDPETPLAALVVPAKLSAEEWIAQQAANPKERIKR